MEKSRDRIRRVIPRDLWTYEEELFNSLGSDRYKSVHAKTTKNLYNRKLLDALTAQQSNLPRYMNDDSRLWHPENGLQIDEEQARAARIRYTTPDHPCRNCKLSGRPYNDTINVQTTQIQKRSADEPMSLQAVCQTCRHQWTVR